MQPGDRADGGDRWFRVITNSSHLTRAGTVHKSALKGTALAPPREGRPWNYELSGRLASLALDPEGEAQAWIAERKARFLAEGRPAPSSFGYFGIMWAKVADIEKPIADSSAQIQVIYTPLGPPNIKDGAHADCVVHDCTEETLPSVRDHLTPLLQVLGPGQANEVRLV